MIVTSASGKQVSIIENKHGILVDTLGNWWTRDADKDPPDAAGYSCKDVNDFMQLNRPELKRVCGGNTAIQQLTTVTEMRDFIDGLKADLREIGNSWNDQQLREILIEADTSNKNCSSLLLSKLNAEYDKQHVVTVETEEYTSCEKEGISLEPKHSAGTSVPPKKKAQRKAKEYAFEGTCDGTDIKLTSKQVTVMLAVLHSTDNNLNCLTANVLQHVSTEMSPISAGAILSTLKEKCVISMDKSAGIINLTRLGAWVTSKLGDVKEDKPNEKDC